MPFLGVVAGLAVVATSFQTGKGQTHPPDPASLELLLLDVCYDHLRLDTDLSALQGADGRRYLPIRQLAATLGLRIHVDQDKRYAEGFLADPSDRVAIDGIRGKCARPGHWITFDPNLCFARDNDLYVEAELVTKIFGFHFNWLLNQLELDVTSDTPLRVRQIWMMRNALDGQPAPQILPAFPVVQMPYGFASIPSMDVSLYSNAALGDKATVQSGSRMQIQGAGDLLFLSARYRYVSAGPGEPASELLSLGRDDPHGGLLGPLKATQFAFGDLDLPQHSLFARARNGLGATISNIPVTNFGGSENPVEGHAPPHSLVELYRGSELLTMVKADDQGHYAFDSIPLDSGPNDLRIVVLTPDGDVQEQLRTVYGDRSGPPPGETQYRLTAARVGDSILPHALAGLNPAQSRTEYIGEYRMGLTQSSWLATTAAEADGTGFLGLGLHSWAGNTLWHFDSMLSGNGGSALSAGLSRQFGRATLSLDHTIGSPSFGSGLAPEISGNVTSMTKLRLDGSMGSRSNPIGYGLSVDRANGSDPATLIRGLVNVREGGTFYANTVAARLSRAAPDVTGVFQATHSYGPISGHFDLGYGLGNERLLQAMQLSIDRGISPNYRMRYGLGYDPERVGGFESSAALFRLVGPLELGLNLSADLHGALRLSLLLSTGFAGGESFKDVALARPGAISSGNVMVRVFLDRNMNGRFDDGDIWLADVGLKIAGRAGVARTGKDGTCLLDNLPSGQDVTLALNEDSFENPAWVAETPGVLVTPRTGHVVHVQFGVIESVELEGSAVGASSAHYDVTAQLLDAAGKPIYMSAVDTDGSFVFSLVRPGDYTLRLVNPSGQSCGERTVRLTPGAVVKGYDVKFVGAKG